MGETAANRMLEREAEFYDLADKTLKDIEMLNNMGAYGNRVEHEKVLKKSSS